MTNPPAFQLYAADFYMDTISWTNEEIGIYFRLLLSEWINGPLEFDAKHLASISQISLRKFGIKWAKIGDKFVLNDAGKVINEKLEMVRAKQVAYREKKSQSGKAGVLAKKKLGIYPFHKSSDALSDASRKTQATLNEKSSSSSSSSSLKDKDPKKEPFQLPTKEEVNESSMPKIKEDLEKVCEHLYETKKFPKVHAFKNKMLKEGKYERAILHTLVRCALKEDFKDTPWGYCIKIIKVENGNYNEYEYRKDKG